MTFSTNSGSVESLKLSARCGLRPKSFQIRPIVDRDRPDLAAIEDCDQCVALRGFDSSVATITSSTWSRLTDEGRPGRSSSTSPSRRRSMNRRRHLPTVGCEHPKSAATCLLLTPGVAQARTIRDRNASACDDVARRAHRCNWARSSPVNVSSAFGRPILGIHQV